MTDAPSPLPAACVQACLAAGLVAAAEVAASVAFSGSHESAPFQVQLLMVLAAFFAAGVIAACHMLLALPLYLLLRGTGPVHTAAAACAGFLIGALPIPILYRPEGLLLGPTWETTLIFGLPGLAAGFAFGRHLDRAAAEMQE